MERRNLPSQNTTPEYTPDVRELIEERNYKETQKVLNIFNKVKQKNLFLTEADLGLTVAPTRKPQYIRNDIYNDLSDEDKQILTENGSFEQNSDEYYQEQVRQQSQVQTSKPIQRYWASQELKAKLTSGSTVPVWKVVNEKTGMELPTPFRLKEVADKITMVLNETGNMNDNRVVKTIDMYNRRIKIVKEVNTLKENTDASSKNKVKILKEELTAIDFKLGV